MSDNATTLVFAPEDVVYQQTELGRNFWISDDLVGKEYSTLFSAQLTKFGPGGGSPLHHHDYNHAFYFLTGTAQVRIGERTWHIKPGTFVKVPANEEHSLTNTGADELVFLVIYDPPHVASD
ncbi:MAG TPA: cupin domain-containing protein [Mycobacterium sp.]|nr:cupin domain-containing protein [Mycobacterium sp.]